MEKDAEHNGNGQNPTFESLHDGYFVGKISYFCHMNTKDFPFIDIHTHYRRGWIASAKGPAMTWPTYGIHPWTLDTVIARSASDEAIHKKLTLLESYLKENRIVAIGETGIDRAHKDTIPLQLEVFEKHILLSEQYQKPLIIHNVRGTADILRLHKKHQPKQAWIIHGFNGTATEANQLTDRGIYLSVGESLFYENRKIHESITSIPLDYLFFETDTSEKTIQEIYEKASELLKLPLDQLKEQIFTNFARLNLDIWNNGMTEPGCSSATMALINSKTAMC
jgi:TatD DNase family protein